MRRRARGFTLIELLVAMMLIALLSAALFSGLRLGARAWETGGERIAEVNDRDAARTFLSHRLSEARPLTVAGHDGEQYPVFQGERRALRFAAGWPPHLGHGGAYVFTLTPARGETGLLLDWSLHRQDGAIDVSGGRERPRRLFIGAENVEFRYYGRRSGQEIAQWHDTWQEDERLPQMIELRMSGGPFEHWPPLRAAVAAAAGGT